MRKVRFTLEAKAERKWELMERPEPTKEEIKQLLRESFTTSQIEDLLHMRFDQNQIRREEHLVWENRLQFMKFLREQGKLES